MAKEKYVVKTELKKIMKENGVSSRGLANKFGDSPSTWSNRLNGFIYYDQWLKVEGFIKSHKKEK